MMTLLYINCLASQVATWVKKESSFAWTYLVAELKFLMKVNYYIAFKFLINALSINQ